MIRAETYTIQCLAGPGEVAGWRISEHFGADWRGGASWHVTHLPTGARLGSHRSLEACVARAERLERRCGNALDSRDPAAVAWAISPARARREGIPAPRTTAKPRSARRMREPETDLTLDTVEQIDALERRGGGKWRESRTLAPGEIVIEDARLT